jgi:hypothetical protein
LTHWAHAFWPQAGFPGRRLGDRNSKSVRRVRPDLNEPVKLPPRDMGYDAAQYLLGFRDEIGRCSHVRTLTGGAEEVNGRPDAEDQIVGKGLVVATRHN